MTLVVTTASLYGISVVGDRQLSANDDRPGFKRPHGEAQKVFYVNSCNIGLALWGSTNLVDDERGFPKLIERFSKDPALAGLSLEAVAELLAEKLREEFLQLRTGDALRRGVHVAGYVDDLPCIYHVHMGPDARTKYPPKVHRDFPDVHGGGIDTYRRHLVEGKPAKLHNGLHQLFNVVRRGANDNEAESPLAQMLRELGEVFDVSIPTPDIHGQAALDKAVVAFCSHLLAAAGKARTIGEELDAIAFTRDGPVSLQAPVAQQGITIRFDPRVATGVTHSFGVAATYSGGPILPDGNDR